MEAMESGCVTISRVVRRGKETARVVLSDGRVAKVKAVDAQQGRSFPSSEFVLKGTSYSQEWTHSSMVKPKARPKVYPTVRDMAKFDCQEELKLLRDKIRFNQDVFGYRLSSEEIEDYAQELFVHFWERGVFQGYDPDRQLAAKYTSYIGKMVRRYLIDAKRSSAYRLRMNSISLSAPLPGMTEDETILQDFLADPNVNLEESVIASVLYSKFQAEVVRLDSVSDPVKGVTYQAVFDSFLGKVDRRELERKLGSRDLATKEEYLRGQLKGLMLSA